MQPLTAQNIECELSYAYLHAVASAAGMACVVADRHNDNAGVDAKLTGWGPFPNGGFLEEVDLKVQLKATIRNPSIKNIDGKEYLSYKFEGISQYNALRSQALSTPRILVVLFLPQDQLQWIDHSHEALLLRKCAYWVSLRSAPKSDNSTSQTVYLPKDQCFDKDGLLRLMGDISRGEVPSYPEVLV